MVTVSKNMVDKGPLRGNYLGCKSTKKKQAIKRIMKIITHFIAVCAGVFLMR